MVQFIPEKDDWAQAFRSIGQGAGEGYLNHSDEMALKKSIGSLPENATPRQILDAITGTRTYKPEAKQTALKNYLGVAEFEELKRKSKAQEQIGEAKNTIAQNKEKRLAQEKEDAQKQTEAIVNQLDLPEEQKEALAGSLDKSAAEGLLRDQISKSKGDVKLSPLQKKLQTKAADSYIKIVEEIPALQDTLKNLEHVRELSNKLGFPGAAAFTIGSKAGTQLESEAFALLQPIIKIFNPSGPIAQKKLEQLSNLYKIKQTDFPWQREGKLNALERFAKQALARAQDKKKLYEEIDRNGGSITEELQEKINREDESLIDAMTDYEIAAQEVDIPELPKPDSFKGQTVESADGKRYYSDGTRWVIR